MLEAVEPVFHAYVVAPAAEIVVELPLQIVVLGLEVIDTVGVALITTEVVPAAPTHPAALAAVTE